MKKSVEILGLPIISITEGRELGMSKTLLIDAKNGLIAAITIEDEDWYRGVKLIPYESVFAIGDDAVTVTNSENILKLDEAGDFENLLDENIRVIGTKAITKSGTIQGKITELFIADDGKIEKCEITAPDGTTTEIAADQISIFGKQVTVIDPDGEKKTEFVGSQMAAMPKASPSPAPAVPAAPEPAAAPQPDAKPAPAPAMEETAAPAEDAAKDSMDAAAEASKPEKDGKEDSKPTVQQLKADGSKNEEPAKAVDLPKDAEPAKDADQPKAAEPPKADEPAKADAQPKDAELPKAPEPPKAAEAPKPEPPKAAEAPKAAKPATPEAQKQQAADKATEERHRRFLLGKKAARTIKMDNGIVIVEAGADITEEVLQKAKLANKFIELSMNVQ